MAVNIIRGLTACLALAKLIQGERNEAASGARHHVLEVASSGHLSRPRDDSARRPPDGKHSSKEAGRAPLQPFTPPSAMLEASVTTGSKTQTKAKFWNWFWRMMGWKGESEEKKMEEKTVFGTKKSYRLMSFNVYYQNEHYKEIAELVAKVGPDIVNFQESVVDSPKAIIDALNARGQEQWKLANTWSENAFWCGLTAYRSDIWDTEWSTEIPVIQDGDRRGICGALLKRKEDDTKVCVWGTHPILRNNSPSSAHWAVNAVKVGGQLIQECELNHTAPSIFMCDCNTIDTEPVTQALKDSTSFKWENAVAAAYTQIHVTTGPHDVGMSQNQSAVNSTAGKSGCKAQCQNELWAYSDHPPVFVDILPP